MRRGLLSSTSKALIDYVSDGGRNRPEKFRIAVENVLRAKREKEHKSAIDKAVADAAARAAREADAAARAAREAEAWAAELEADEQAKKEVEQTACEAVAGTGGFLSRLLG